VTGRAKALGESFMLPGQCSARRAGARSLPKVWVCELTNTVRFRHNKKFGCKVEDVLDHGQSHCQLQRPFLTTQANPAGAGRFQFGYSTLAKPRRGPFLARVSRQSKISKLETSVSMLECCTITTKMEMKRRQDKMFSLAPRKFWAQKIRGWECGKETYSSSTEKWHIREFACTTDAAS
jgi:hypothetical protein